MADLTRLRALIGRLGDAAEKRGMPEPVRACIRDARTEVEALDRLVSSLRAEAWCARAESRQRDFDLEKAWQDGYAAGLAAGFGECSRLMSRIGGGHGEG